MWNAHDTDSEDEEVDGIAEELARCLLSGNPDERRTRRLLAHMTREHLMKVSRNFMTMTAAERKTIWKLFSKVIEDKSYKMLKHFSNSAIFAMQRDEDPEAWQLFDKLLATCSDIKSKGGTELSTEEESDMMMCYEMASKMLPHLIITDVDIFFNSPESLERICKLYEFSKHALEVRFERNCVRELLMMWPCSADYTSFPDCFNEKLSDFLKLVANGLNEPRDDERDASEEGRMWIKRLTFAAIVAIDLDLKLFANILREFEEKTMPDSKPGFLLESYIRRWLQMVTNRLDRDDIDPLFELNFDDLPNALISCRGLRAIKAHRREFKYYNELVGDLNAARRVTENKLKMIAREFSIHTTQGLTCAMFLPGLEEITFP